MKKLFVIAALSSAALTPAYADFIGKVVRISDGDTVTVLNSKNEQIRVRFNQIDAPESSQAFGQKSRQNISFIHNQQVYVREDSIDRYGRTVGTIYLTVNGKVPNLQIENSVNFKQVHDGYAWAYRQYVKDPVILSAETNARVSKKGLWQDPNPIPPWNYRHNK